MTPPPGWYPSPDDPDFEQYWDGGEWTPEKRHANVVVPELLEGLISGNPNPRPTNVNIKPAWVLRFFAAILLFAGGIPMLITLPVVAPSITGQTASYVKATGTVVDIDYSTTGKDSKGRRSNNCAPIAEFTVHGTKHTAKSDIFISPCAWTMGQKVDITYDPNNPARTGTVDQTAGQVAVMWLFFVVGFALTATGLGLLLKSFLPKKPEVRQE